MVANSIIDAKINDSPYITVEEDLIGSIPWRSKVIMLDTIRDVVLNYFNGGVMGLGTYSWDYIAKEAIGGTSYIYTRLWGMAIEGIKDYTGGYKIGG